MIYGGERAVRDRYNYVFILFLLLGISWIFPWNIYVKSVLYYEERLKKTVVSGLFMTITSFTYTGTSLLTLGVLLYSQYLQKTFAIIRAIKKSLGFEIFFLLVAASFPLYDFLTVKLDLPQIMPKLGVFFGSQVIVILAAICATIILRNTQSLTPLFKPKYNTALLIGQSTSALIATTIALISTSGTIGNYLSVKGLPNIPTLAWSIVYYSAAMLIVSFAYAMFSFNSESKYFSSVVYDGQTSQEAETIQGANPTFVSPIVSLRGVAKHVPWHLAGIFFNYLITLSLYPGLTSLIKPIAKSAKSHIYIPLHFLAFDLGDTGSRILLLIWDIYMENTSAAKTLDRISPFLPYIRAPLILVVMFLIYKERIGIKQEWHEPLFFSTLAILGFTNGLFLAAMAGSLNRKALDQCANPQNIEFPDTYEEQNGMTRGRMLRHEVSIHAGSLIATMNISANFVGACITLIVRTYMDYYYKISN